MSPNTGPWFRSTSLPGMNLHIYPTKQFKTVTLVLMMQQALTEEAVTPTAMLAQVLKRGSTRYPTIQAMKRYLDNLYGASFQVDVDKRGERQVLQFYLDLPHAKYLSGEKDMLEKGVAFLADVLLHPLVDEQGGFSPRYVEAGKDSLRRQIQGIIDDKIRYAQERCIEEMCQNEPFRLLPYGRLEDLETVESKPLFQHYQRVLEQSPIDLFVVGQVQEQDIVSAVQRHFTFQTRQVKPLSPAGGDPIHVEEVRSVVEELDVTQGKLNLGLRTGGLTLASPEYPALMVYNGLLGGFAHSKLFRNVREKASLAYYASSRLDSLKGILMIQTGIEVSNYQRTLDIVKEQLEMMRQGNFSQLEIEQTKSLLVHHLREVHDRAGLLVDYAFRGLVAGVCQTPDELIQRILSVTREEIRQVAERIELDTVYFLRNRQQEEGAV